MGPETCAQLLDPALQCEPVHIDWPSPELFIDWGELVCKMTSKSDLVTTISAAFVAAYAAVAIGYVARYDLGFSLQEIRDAALVIAVVIATVVAIDFFGKKLRKAK